MIDYKKTMLAVLGLWAFAPSAFCQNNGVWIGASSSAGDFPASNSTAMAAAPTGDFHTGIVSVGEMERISFADYGDGGSPRALEVPETRSFRTQRTGLMKSARKRISTLSPCAALPPENRRREISTSGPTRPVTNRVRLCGYRRPGLPIIPGRRCVTAGVWRC